MPSRNDRSSEGTEAGGESPPEPLVDRRLELDMLRQHIARVTGTGKGHAVLILDESGVGKSRLAAEAGTEARRRGMAVIFCAAPRPVSFAHSLMQHEVYAEMGANQRRYLHAGRRVV